MSEWGGVKAEKVNWNPSGYADWIGTWSSNTFSWNKNGNGWYLINTGLETGNISRFTHLYINITSIAEGAALDDSKKYINFKISSTGKSEQRIKLYEGENTIDIANYSYQIDFTQITEIALEGTLEGEATSGSAVIADCYLYNDVVTLASTELSDFNGNCKYEKGKFCWWASTSCTARVLSFKAGVLSKFSKIKFSCSGLTEGCEYRFIVVTSDGNYQKEFSATGDNLEINLSDLHKQWYSTMITDELIASATDLRIGGNTIAGTPTSESPITLTIDPTSIYLEADWEVLSIADASDWTAFSNLVDAGLTSLQARLTADITVSDGKMIGTDSKPYSGTFDGRGHAIDFTYSGSESIIGPFRYVNATTIHDLKTTGRITSSNNLLGGIIGKNLGATVLTRCWSSMSITSTDGGNGRVGGLVGRCADNGSPATNTIEFNYCVYDGNISTATSGYACGFIGWDNVSAATLNNCLVASTSITNGGCNFTNQTPTISDGKYAYYLTKFGTNNQGTQLNKQLLTSGQAAWNLNQGIGDGAWFFGQGNLNTSMVDACPALTTDNTKKVVRTQAEYTGTKLYVNPGGAIPNAVRLKALGWYIGDTESDVLTSIPSDFAGGDNAIKRTRSYFKLKVGAAGATTLMVPFTTTSLPENLKAYDLTFDGTQVTATKVDVITANKPVLINAPAGEYLFSAAATGMNDMTLADGWIVYGSSTYSNGALTGVYNEAGSSSASDPFSYVPADAYVLQNGADGLGFYKVDNADEIKITSFRAYLTAPTTARSLSIVFADEEATGINDVKSQKEVVNNEFFNLSGQRVSQPTKGLYIVNGKKVIRK